MMPRVLWLALAVLVTVPATGAAKPRRATPDRVWTHPDLDRLRPERIAVLPAVSFVYLPKERSYLEDVWLMRFGGSRHSWVPAVLCREHMASTSRRGDSLMSAIGNQVRGRGRVDSTSAPALARLLRSQALLCLRIDRWERISGRVYVDLTVALVDSAGRLLWKVTSEERLETVYGIPKIPDAKASPGVVTDESYERWRATNERTERFMVGRPGEAGMTMQSSLFISPDFQAALGRILARLERTFPESRRRPAATVAR